jgi:hypothetical protein
MRRRMGEERMGQFEALTKDVSNVLEENRAVTTERTGGRRSEEWL